MENLKTIKNRLRTIGSIIKAMNSVKMVATVKLSRVSNANKHAQECARLLSDMFTKAAREYSMTGTPERDSWIYQKTGKSLIVVLSSDQGFSGSFTQYILDAALGAIRRYDNAKIVYFGKKGREAVAEVSGGVEEITSHPAMHSVSEFSAFLSEMVSEYVFNHGIDQIIVVSGKFENIIIQRAKASTIFPVLPSGAEDASVTLEGNPQDCLNELFRMYVHESFVGLLTEHLIAEFSARVMAMDASVRNANDMFSNLRIQYNKIRQDRITQELTEIIASIECVS
ncbi:MAG: F0F1 ATP synthase subunit gamma [Holosporales bacterium]|jgi:F-type H+-transporting ATPase subunit gamma|nr:F0F1 ATP synthase subunit gamma [Holosporales bacterium]